MSNKEPETISNAFSRFLSDFRSGSVAGELSEAMTKCVAAARETGKPAELKYVLKFSPNGEAMVVTDKLDTKLPGQDRKGAIFFVGEDNNLTRDNPEQRTLDLKTVEAPKQEIKEVTPVAVAIAYGNRYGNRQRTNTSQSGLCRDGVEAVHESPGSCDSPAELQSGVTGEGHRTVPPKTSPTQA